MNLNELEKRLRGHAKITKSTVTTPFNLKTTLNKLEEKNMNKFKNITWLKRLATTAAVLAICAVTVVSANSLKGYFKDVKNITGAVTGTEYLNATNDIKIDFVETTDEYITLDLTFVNPNEAPFAYIEEIAVNEYKILDKNAEEVLSVNWDLEHSIVTKIKNGEVLIELPLKDIPSNSSDSYTLKIDTIYGLSKADQPLKITGDWKCEFKR